ncbi:MAG: acyl--CoA ligase [Phycisphaerales bacterium]|nr:MAG: acyl--CoA ligase [Phycisphaerales bacterium]
MEIDLRYRNLTDLFEAAVSTKPAKVCVEIIRADRRETLTFGHLQHRARTLARDLTERHAIRAHDRVALVSRNRADWDVALWGIILAGAVPVLIDPERGSEGVAGHLKATDARALILADDYEDRFAREELLAYAQAHRLACIMMTDTPLAGEALSDGDNDHVPGRDAQTQDTAIVLCTSGTTGDPREVELTHTNLIANIQGSVDKVRITPQDVLGHILPPHHSFGLTVGKLLPFAVGATNIYTNRYRDVPDLICSRGITIFIAIPALFTTLAKKLEEGINKQKEKSRVLRFLDRHFPKYVGRKIRQKQGWSQLRFFLSGAAPMPRWVLDSLWKRGYRMYEGYGTTENSPVYGFNEDLATLGSVGRPINTLSVKIVDEENQTLPPLLRGEICLGGPCIMKGYYKNPVATKAVIDTDEKGVRWLRTGDLGYLDEAGNLHITGRKKYLIILPGGKNVNPERVEKALSEAHFVKEVLVVPTRRIDANGIMEETMRALVQPAWETIESHTGQSRAELSAEPHTVKGLVWESIRDCQQKNKQLSSFEKIASHHLEIHTEDFLKTSTGKIKREHYMNLEHLEAKHTRIEAYRPAATPKEPRSVPKA